MTLTGPVFAQAEAIPATTILPFIARRDDAAGCVTSSPALLTLPTLRAHREAGTGTVPAQGGAPQETGGMATILPFRRGAGDVIGGCIPSREVAAGKIMASLAAAGERLSLPVARLAQRWPSLLGGLALVGLAAIYVMGEEPAHFGNDEQLLTPPMVVTVELVAEQPAEEEISATAASEEDAAPAPEVVEVPAPPELPPITPAQFEIPEAPAADATPVVRPKPEKPRATVVRQAAKPDKPKAASKARSGKARPASTARQAASAQSMRAMRDYLGRVRSAIYGRLSSRVPEGRVVMSFGIAPNGHAYGASVSGSGAVRAAALDALRGGFGAVPAGVNLPGRLSVVINFK